MREITYRQALNEALAEELERDPNVFLMGEEVAEYQGAYKVSHGLLERFGPRRIIDTPISENGFAGLVVPSKLQGYMARGMPVLYIGPDSDVERFITRSQGGVCFRCDDVEGVATALIDLAGNRDRLALLAVRARQFYEQEFARQHGLSRYETVIRSLLDETASAP